MPKDDALMKLMSGGTKEKSEASVASESPAGPVGVGMSTPQANEGAQAAATAKVALGLKILGLALEPYGSESKEGGAIMDAISKLTKTFGLKLDEGQKLIPAELKMLMEAAGAQTPEMQAAQQPPGQGGAAAPMLKAA